MPRGPKGEKRKADVIGNAVHVMRIATGQEQDEPPKPKGALAVARGAAGGTARAANLPPAKRRKIAQKAAKARWKDGAGSS